MAKRELLPVHATQGILSQDPVQGVAPIVVPSISIRYRSPGLLCLGATAGLCAFGGTFLVTVMQFFRVTGSELLDLHPYPSGLGYWPETVSESVHNRNSPAGKIFFTGCLIAAILFFLSWYPFSLRNVYTGPETTCCGSMYSTTFRQYMPTIGLLMLIGVSTYPSSVAKQTAGGQVCVMLHLIGAGMMFVGYMFAEFSCLEMLGFSHEAAVEYQYLSIEGLERRIRQGTVSCMGCCFLLFLVFEGLLMLPASVAPCCIDEWTTAGQWVTRTTPTGVQVWDAVQEPKTNNTATGPYLAIKMGAYFAECLAGIFLIMSHCTIFYFCEERQVEYGMSTLEMVYDDETDPVESLTEFKFMGR